MAIAKLSTRDSRVDRYIADAPAFAQPILEHLRETIHEGCPEVEEDIKWSRPAFVYRGKMLFGMAAFKSHCGMGFWIGPVNRMIEKDGYDGGGYSGSVGRVKQLSDLPPKKQLLGYIREARRLIEESRIDPPAPRKRASSPRVELEMPEDFVIALKKDKKAGKNFESLSPSHKREYIEWILEAKREETRQKRIATALAWLAEGKPRNWKYM